MTTNPRLKFALYYLSFKPYFSSGFSLYLCPTWDFYCIIMISLLLALLFTRLLWVELETNVFVNISNVIAKDNGLSDCWICLKQLPPGVHRQE